MPSYSKIALFSAILLVFFTSSAYAQVVSSTPPTVSIGVGNGNTPANTGPQHGSIFHGNIPVYATVNDPDNDLENYHFRVVKDGGSLGFTCTVPDGLFLPENQGYASSTLGKDACGYVYNQSIYTGTNFTNSIITTLNTIDLGAYSGDGNYWLILGARDTTGNRTNPDYLTDSQVEITVDNTAPMTTSSIGNRRDSDLFTIFGTSTDTNGVANTTVSYANFDGTNCGTFSQAGILNGGNTAVFPWTFEFNPNTDGNYCLSVSSTDLVGNKETDNTIETNIPFLSSTTPTPTPTPSPSPSPAPSPSPTPAPNSAPVGGNGPIVGTFGKINGQGSNDGQVLGESTTTLPSGCVPVLTSYLISGGKNNKEDVKTLQNFLNKYFGTNIPVNGIFGPQTLAAVYKFQAKESEEVLMPWVRAGLWKSANPTGYVYKTTSRRINMLSCIGEINIPMPQLP